MKMWRQGPALFVQAPAKLNLFLKVLGRRSDGYHDLETLMVSLRWYDTLRFLRQDDPQITLECVRQLRSAADIPNDERNLIVRAARLLQSTTQSPLGVQITAWKRLPSEAGLGGGSSDAAATLVALNQLWALNLSGSQLHELAAQLGSDVNFFLDSENAARCTGRGEQIRPVFLNGPLPLVIVKPEQGLSTAEVFGGWLKAETRTRFSFGDAETACGSRSHGQLGRVIHNDLQPPARKLSPAVDRILSRMERLPIAGSGMTGSGSACFALCRTQRQARHVAGHLKHQRLGSVFVVSAGV